MVRFVIFIAIILFSGIIQAQEEKVALDSVVVQGRFYPMTMNKVDENYTIIASKEIQEIPTQSIEELLSFYTGVDLRRRGINGMQSDISLGGGTFEQVLLLINGVRVNDAQTAHNQLQLPFDLQSVERIEIIKGPAARKYGANAFSGVVNVITKIKDHNSITIRGLGASYGTYEAGLSANMGKTHWKNRLDVQYGSSDGYRHNTDYTKSHIFYQSSYPLQKGEINLQAGFIEKKFGANGFYATPSATEQYEKTQMSIVSFGLSQKVKNIGLKANTYWKRSQDMYLFVRDNPALYRNMHIGNNIGADLNASFYSSLGLTGVGAEWRSEDLQSNNLGKRNRNITSLYVEHNFSLFKDKLNITPGFNWSNFSSVGNFFYPGIELGYDINRQNKIYASTAKVHRVPSYTELYYVSRTEEGNPELRPETANSYEIGYRYVRPNFSSKISLFQKDSDNLIDWVKGNEEDKWRTENIAQVKTQGVEFNVKKNFKGFVKAFEADYTFLDKKIKEIATNFSRYSIQNLKHQLIFKMENMLGNNLSSTLTLRYLDRVNLEDYSLLDLKLKYQKNAWHIYTFFNNILDTEYTETNLVPMPGFWISAGVNYGFTF